MRERKKKRWPLIDGAPFEKIKAAPRGQSSRDMERFKALDRSVGENVLDTLLPEEKVSRGQVRLLRLAIDIGLIELKAAGVLGVTQNIEAEIPWLFPRGVGVCKRKPVGCADVVAACERGRAVLGGLQRA